MLLFMISVKNTFLCLNLLLVAGVLYYSVEIFYKSLESRMAYTRVSGKTDEPLLEKSKKSASPYAHYTPITKRDLFKTGKEVAQQDDTIDVEALKLTELNLKLWGTVANEGGNSSFAVIEEVKTRKQSLYRAGDSIQNATVKAILREKVILSVNGKDEILEMATASSEKAPAGQTRTRAPAQKDITLERSFVNDAVKDIGNLLGQVRIRPHFEKGKPSGLRMTGIRPNSIFRKMGLRSGDVLTGVDGQQIQSVNDVIGLYEKLKSSSKVDLEVKRRNRLQTITYRIN
jgi:general secretion pathway protein C